MQCLTTLQSIISETESIYTTRCLDENKMLKTRSWMGDLGPDIIGHLTFSGLSMLGTHDSGTAAITVNSETTGEKSRFLVASVAKQWSRAQGESVYTQLTMGVRYLDLRLMPRKLSVTFSEMWIVHALFCLPHKTVLAEIMAFLQENPAEVIMIDYQRVLQAGEDNNLLDSAHFGLFMSELHMIADWVIPVVSSKGDPFDMSTATFNDIWNQSNKKARIFALIPPHFTSPLWGNLMANYLPAEYSGFENLFSSRDRFIDYQWYNETECSAVRRRMVGACKDRLLVRVQDLLPVRIKELGPLRVSYNDRKGAEGEDVMIPDTFFLLTPHDTYLAIDEGRLSAPPGQRTQVVQSLSQGLSCAVTLERFNGGTSKNHSKEYVALRSRGGRYISLTQQGLFELKDFVGANEKFLIRKHDETESNMIALYSPTHDKYIRCHTGNDGYMVSAVNEPSPQAKDCFLLLPVPRSFALQAGEAFYFQTYHGTFLAVDEGSRGAAADGQPYNVLSHSLMNGSGRATNLFILERQGPITVAIRSYDGMYLSMQSNGTIALRHGVGPWERFEIVKREQQKDSALGEHISIYSVPHRRFITAHLKGAANGSATQPAWETFVKIPISDEASPYHNRLHESNSSYTQIRTVRGTVICLPNSTGNVCLPSHTVATSIPSTRICIEPYPCSPHDSSATAVAFKSHEGHYLSMSLSGTFQYVDAVTPEALFDLQPHPNAHDLAVSRKGKPKRESETKPRADDDEGWFALFNLAHKVYLFATSTGAIAVSPDLFCPQYSIDNAAFRVVDPAESDYCSVILKESLSAVASSVALPVAVPIHTEQEWAFATSTRLAEYEGKAPAFVYVTGAVVTPDEDYIINHTKRRGWEKFGSLVFGESKPLQGSQAALRRLSRIMNPIAVAYFKGISTPYSSERRELLTAMLDALVPDTVHLSRCQACSEVRRLAAQLARAHWGCLCCCVRPKGWRNIRVPIDSSHDYRTWWWAREQSDGDSKNPRCLWCTTSCDRNVLQLDFVEEEGLTAIEVCIKTNIMRRLSLEAAGV